MELPKEEKQIDVALSGLMQKEWQLSGGLLALEHFFLKTTFDQVLENGIYWRIRPSKYRL